MSKLFTGSVHINCINMRVSYLLLRQQQKHGRRKKNILISHCFNAEHVVPKTTWLTKFNAFFSAVDMSFVCWTSLDVLIVMPEVAYCGCSNTIIPCKWCTEIIKGRTTKTLHYGTLETEKRRIFKGKKKIKITLCQNANYDKSVAEKIQGNQGDECEQE